MAWTVAFALLGAVIFSITVAIRIIAILPTVASRIITILPS